MAMGLAQLAWLPGVSAHAAVHESVSLAMDRELGFVPHKGLVFLGLTFFTVSIGWLAQSVAHRRRGRQAEASDQRENITRLL